MRKTNREQQAPRRTRTIRLAVYMGTACAFAASFFPIRAGELRFTSPNGVQQVESRPISQPTNNNESDLVNLLDSTLDHRQRKLAEEKLDEPLYLPDAEVQYADANADAFGASPYVVPEEADDAESAGQYDLQPRRAEAQPQYAERSEIRTDVSAVPNAASFFNSSAYAKTSSAADEAARELLAVDDVKEFSEQNQEQEELADETYLQEINEDYETEAKLEAITFTDVADECFFALDPYSSLFIEYEPTAQWTDSVLQYVEDVLNALDQPSETTAALLSELQAKLAETDALKTALIEADKQADQGALNASEPGKLPRLAERYSLKSRIDALDAFKNMLQRRVYLWSASLDYFNARNAGRLTAPREIPTPALVKLLSETTEVKMFFGDSPNGRSWRNSFDVDLLAEDVAAILELQSASFEPVKVDLGSRNPSDQALEDDESKLDSEELSAIGKPLSTRELYAMERARRMRFLLDRLNSVAYKLEKTPMTQEQRQVFKRPTLASWSETARSYSCDQANGTALLYQFERYENSGGGQAARDLQQLALRMSSSRSEEARAFGRAVDAIYDNPNVKAYVSEALINRLLPIKDPEFGVVQERILNNPVAGKRRVDTTVSIELTPNPNRLLMNLVVNGKIATSTSSEAFSVKLHNESYATYIGKKALEWRDSGVAYAPAVVAANSVNNLKAVETDVDFVPLVGGVAREVVRAQYESKQGEIRAQVRSRVTQEARNRIDSEANERFDQLNATLRDGFFTRLNNLGLSLRMQRSKTTDDWLLASLRLGSEYSLGGQTSEPATLDGAFADVKLHESALNSYLARLDLAGRESDPQDTIEFLAEKLDRPKLREVQLDDNDLSYTFAKSDPLIVRFFEDQIQLRLRFVKMALGANEWDDLEIVVNYRPSIGPDGRPTFTRDGVVEIYGPTNIRSLLPLRAIFSKVFPAQKTFDLKPEIFDKDDRFAGLALGLCRVSRGWFALSVVRNDAVQY